MPDDEPTTPASSMPPKPPEPQAPPPVPQRTVLEPPNGHIVSGAELYEALYNMDLANAARHNLLSTQIEGARSDQRQLRTEFATHTQDGHPWVDRVGVVKEEIKLDAKKAGIVAGFLAVVTAIVGYFAGLDWRPF